MPHIPAPAVWEQVEETVTHPPPQVLVIGGVAVDVSCDTVAAPALHTSNPCSITESLGGVANNVAYALHLSGTPTRLVSCIGNDVSGRWIKEQIQARGMDTSGLTVSPTAATARYVAVNDASGNLFVAAADMHAIASMSAATLTAAITASDAPCVILDGNLGAKSTVSILRHCHKTNTKGTPPPPSPPLT